MRCFILEGCRIAGLASELVKLHSGRLPLRGDGEPHDRESLADAMLALNLDAFRQRYGVNVLLTKDLDSVDLDRKNWLPLDAFSPTQLFKSLQCFLYQCSEGNVPERSLFKALDALLNLLGPAINQESPEYAAAIWG
jgi:hypothetical protein